MIGRDFLSLTFWPHRVFGFDSPCLKFETPWSEEMAMRRRDVWHLTNTRGRKRIPESEMEFFVSSFSQSMHWLVQLYDLAWSADQFYWQHFTGLACKRHPSVKERTGRESNGGFCVSGQNTNEKLSKTKSRWRKPNRLKKNKKIKISLRCCQLFKDCDFAATAVCFFTIQNCLVVGNAAQWHRDCFLCESSATLHCKAACLMLKFWHCRDM